MAQDELIRRVNEAFEALVAAVQGLDESRLLERWYGEWGLREIMAHVAGWHWEMEKALDRLSRGERPVPEGVDYSNADSWNARFAEQAARKSGREVLEDLRASKEAFVKAALKVPEDRFEQGRSAARIMETTGFGHYAEHLPAIQEWRRREGI